MNRTALSPGVSDEYRAKLFRTSSNWRIAYNGLSCDIPVVAWDGILSSIFSTIEDKIMFPTAKGYLGMKWKAVERGDFICILFGGETPFIRNRLLVNLISFPLESVMFIVSWTERLCLYLMSIRQRPSCSFRQNSVLTLVLCRLMYRVECIH